MTPELNEASAKLKLGPVFRALFFQTQATFIKITPVATSPAALMRSIPKRSLSSRVPMSAAKMTLVSRSAYTAAMAARLMAQITSP
ncbi:MAG: hypothetical protein R3337_06080 [Gammaproteobacteria bacterium]|nr:hypothetical protein [Gammaproteobacteria bacterium]